MEPYLEVAEISIIKSERNKLILVFFKVFGHAVRIANKVGSTIKIPCIASSQQHHSNVPAIFPGKKFHRNVAFPLLDHKIIFMDQ